MFWGCFSYDKKGPMHIWQKETAAQRRAASKHQAAVYDAAGVSRLLWMGNSPDLNAIEPTWAYLKRETTKKGAPIARSVAEKAWTKAWKDLKQWRIQRWIRRIMYHVKEIIRCK